MNEPPIHNLLTVKETAEYLRIPIATVYYLAQRTMIPAIRIGDRWRTKKSSRTVTFCTKTGKAN